MCVIDPKRPLRLSAPYPAVLDPTRRMDKPRAFHLFDRTVVEMHHMSFVRRDIRLKMRNVSNRTVMNEGRNEWSWWA